MSGGTGADARLDGLLEQALALEAADRQRFIDELGDQDAPLADELRALLALAEADDFLAAPEGAARWRALFDDAPPDDPTPLPGPIGPWRPLRRLGEGGMGTVWLVEREAEGFRQTGALKLLRPGADSEGFLRRFAEERRILATLHHPGIARLLDGGRAEDGRPWLVMEYVEGEPIDVACDERRLDVPARIALFRQVAEAVATAHRNLIAHRDLKPGNILVGDDGAPRLLDFGIAKALDGPGAEGAPTATQLRAFTPDYATPEQVQGHPTSTATDVYQLGLLLYELLCGHRAQQASDASPRAIELAVCTTEPLRPSVRLDADARAAAQAIAAARATTPAGLRRALRGDLDNIVLKALRKAPERRYASVAALIEDLDRWRDGRTVRARPEIWAYRSGKFLRRHAWATAAVVAVFASTVIYAVVATRQAEALARERDRAQVEALKAKQTLALLKRVFASADPRQNGGEPLNARQMLDRGWASIQGDLDAQPDVAVELLDVVGEAYRQAGEYGRARDLFERALRTVSTLPSASPEYAAQAERNLGRVISDQGDYPAGERHLRAALDAYRRLAPGPDPEVATTLLDLGQLFDRRGDLASAGNTYREALAMRRALYGERHPGVAESLSRLALVLREQADYAGAKPLFEQSLTLRRQLLPAAHPDLLASLSNLAMVRNDLGEYDAAERLYREALDGLVRALGPDHPDVAIVECNLGRLLQARRDHDGARALYEDALRIRLATLGAHHAVTAENLNDLGLLAAERGDASAARDYYRRALDAYPRGHIGRGATVFNLGRLAENAGDFATAERRYREALALQRHDYGPEHDRVGADLNRLGIVLHRQGRLDEAERSMRQALAIYRARLPAGHVRLAVVLVPLGRLLTDRGHRDEARALLEEALEVRRNGYGADDPRTADAAAALAAARRGG